MKRQPCPACGEQVDRLKQGALMNVTGGRPPFHLTDCPGAPVTAPTFAALPADPSDLPVGVDRDRYKRPLIIPPGGGQPLPYTRVSTFAGYLDNGHGLGTWKARNVALGVARHDDLRRMIAGLAYGDPLLDEHIETALCRVDDKAAWGTAVHSFTEPGGSPYVPPEMLADVTSYFDVTKALGITAVHTELFVVNDDLKVAGTLDHVYDVPGRGLLVGDKKTGKKKPQAVSIQLACYAGSFIYDPATGARTPLGTSLDSGLLVHIPKEEGRTEVFTVDLVKGRAAAELALRIKAFNEDTGLLEVLQPTAPTPAPSDTPVLDLVALVAGATTGAELLALHAQAVEQGLWNEQLKALFSARKTDITTAA